MTDSKSAAGGCFCGAIRYRASGGPVAKALCHCRSCQRACGAPSVGWVVFKASEFAFTSGEPTRFASSPGVTRTFCSHCGTPLTYQSEKRPALVDITTATLDDPNAFAPPKEIWLSHKIAWEAPNPEMKQYPESSV